MVWPTLGSRTAKEQEQEHNDEMRAELLTFLLVCRRRIVSTAIMTDISGLNLPLDVKAKLAELDLELSEGWLNIVHM